MSDIVLTDPPDLRSYGVTQPTLVCPVCGATAERRIMSQNFGPRHWPICQECGHEFRDEEQTHGTIPGAE